MLPWAGNTPAHYIPFWRTPPSSRRAMPRCPVDTLRYTTLYLPDIHYFIGRCLPHIAVTLPLPATCPALPRHTTYPPHALWYVLPFPTYACHITTCLYRRITSAAGLACTTTAFTHHRLLFLLLLLPATLVAILPVHCPHTPTFCPLQTPPSPLPLACPLQVPLGGSYSVFYATIMPCLPVALIEHLPLVLAHTVCTAPGGPHTRLPHHYHYAPVLPYRALTHSGARITWRTPPQLPGRT